MLIQEWQWGEKSDNPGPLCSFPPAPVDFFCIHSRGLGVGQTNDLSRSRWFVEGRLYQRSYERRQHARLCSFTSISLGKGPSRLQISGEILDWAKHNTSLANGLVLYPPLQRRHLLLVPPSRRGRHSSQRISRMHTHETVEHPYLVVAQLNGEQMAKNFAQSRRHGHHIAVFRGRATGLDQAPNGTSHPCHCISVVGQQTLAS